MTKTVEKKLPDLHLMKFMEHQITPAALLHRKIPVKQFTPFTSLSLEPSLVFFSRHQGRLIKESGEAGPNWRFILPKLMQLFREAIFIRITGRQRNGQKWGRPAARPALMLFSEPVNRIRVRGHIETIPGRKGPAKSKQPGPCFQPEPLHVIRSRYQRTQFSGQRKRAAVLLDQPREQLPFPLMDMSQILIDFLLVGVMLFRQFHYQSCLPQEFFSLLLAGTVYAVPGHQSGENGAF